MTNFKLRDVLFIMFCLYLTTFTYPQSYPPFNIYNIRFSPSSPASLHYGQKVKITFNYCGSTKHVRVCARPMTGNNPTPGYQASALKSVTACKGTHSQYFLFTNGRGVVDKVRFQIYHQTQNRVLYEKSVPVNYVFPHPQSYPPFNIYNIRFSPSSPAALTYGQKVEITFNYCGSTKHVRVCARPMTGDNPTPGYQASSLKSVTACKGTHSQHFLFTSGRGVVDKVRFQIYHQTQNMVLYEKSVSVKYIFPKYSTQRKEE